MNKVKGISALKLAMKESLASSNLLLILMSIAYVWHIFSSIYIYMYRNIDNTDWDDSDTSIIHIIETIDCTIVTRGCY